jgi:hypothetical protein
MLEVPGRKPLPVALSDLSLGGLGVDGLDQSLPVDAFVTVSFSVSLAQDASHHRVLAQVVHSRAHQAGLLFIEPGSETLQALRALLAQPVSKRVDTLAHPHAA